MNKYTKYENQTGLWNRYFKSLLDITPELFKETPCWVWNLSQNNCGYGEVLLYGRRLLLHRLSYAIFNGPLIAPLVIDHLCRNRGCCNPAHLEQVTTAENNRRGNAGQNFKDRAKLITHCPQGHEYNEDNIKWAVRPDGSKSRQCKICNNNSVKKAYWKKREGVSKKQRDQESYAKPRQTHCKNGHEFTPENTRVRITNDGHNGSPREKHECIICLKAKNPDKKVEGQCRKGHSYENNVRYKKNKDGTINYNSKVCLTCEKERRDKYDSNKQTACD